jgi:hypothetical protein
VGEGKRASVRKPCPGRKRKPSRFRRRNKSAITPLTKRAARKALGADLKRCQRLMVEGELT